MSKIVPKLYISLLRLARKFDTHGLSKLLIYRVRGMNDGINVGAQGYYEEILDSIFKNKKYISCEDVATISITRIIKEVFRRPNIDDISVMNRIDAAFGCYRKLSSIFNSYQHLVLNLQASASSEVIRERNSPPLQLSLKASPLTLSKRKLKPGTILLSHPLVPGTFNKAVVLILEVTPQITYGLILNKPSHHNIRSGIRGLSQDAAQVFSENKVYFGGNHEIRLQFLHREASLGGRPIPNTHHSNIDDNNEDSNNNNDTSKLTYYTGGDFEKATQLAKLNAELAQECLFFAGCCQWSHEDLLSELDSGYWIPCTVPIHSLFATSPSSSSPAPSTVNTATSPPATAAIAITEEVEPTTSSATIDPSVDTQSLTTHQMAPLTTAANMVFTKDLWSSLMTSLGEHHALTATLPNSLNYSQIESIDWMM